ncbi:MAG TPA: bifunctional lytic transglycosylase/C40 family peptidase [Acidimicrobiales bacterium]
MKLALAGLVSGLLAVVFLPVVVVAALAGGIGAPAGAGAGSAVIVDGIPTAAVSAYVAAAAWCPGLSWAVLAAIGEVESDHGRSTLPGVASGANAFGAEGPMQFLPATFSAYAVALDGFPPSPYVLADAAVAAARMLCADGGGTPGGLPAALFAYNHSPSYVEAVLGWARTYEGAAVPVAGDPGAVAAAWALTQLGKPYVWGADGPDAYDCSGLTLRAWEAAGFTIPRVAAAQYGAGRQLGLADARPGDLVFFAPDPADPTTIAHVGIYLGAGMMVDAPHPGSGVRVEPVYPQGLLAEVTRPSG